jgi:hypothetical protein
MANGHSTAFKLYVNDGHTVNQQHHIATAVVEYFRLFGKAGLLYYLVTALACGYFLAVVIF